VQYFSQGRCIIEGFLKKEYTSKMSIFWKTRVENTRENTIKIYKTKK